MNKNLLKHDQLELKCNKLLELGVELVVLSRALYIADDTF